MIETYTVFIDRNLHKEEFEQLSSYVSCEKRERIRRFRRFEDTQRSLLGEVLARYAICKRLGIKNNEITFGQNEYGKPVLTDLSSIHFNISHSGDWVVCAIDNNPIGIDVESIKPIEFSIAESFFSKEEYTALSNQDKGAWLIYFYRLWTLKESYIKAEGKGLSIPLKSFTINIERNKISISSSQGSNNYHFKQLELDKEHMLAICSCHNDFGTIHHVNNSLICEEIQL